MLSDKFCLLAGHGKNWYRRFQPFTCQVCIRLDAKATPFMREAISRIISPITQPIATTHVTEIPPRPTTAHAWLSMWHAAMGLRALTLAIVRRGALRSLSIHRGSTKTEPTASWAALKLHGRAIAFRVFWSDVCGVRLTADERDNQASRTK